MISIILAICSVALLVYVVSLCGMLLKECLQTTLQLLSVA